MASMRSRSRPLHAAIRAQAGGTAALVLALALPAAPAAASGITLYEHIDYGGKSLTLSGAVAALGHDWNDRASSVRVEGGAWELCRHRDFAQCQRVEADQPDLRVLDLNDELTSLRPAAGGTGATGSDATSAGSSAAASAPRESLTAAAFAGRSASVNGYLEYRGGDALVVDGQALVATPSTRFRGSGDARTIAGIPLGYQVEASGVRRADGAIAVSRLEAKPNGQQAFESDVRKATDDLEAAWRARGELLTASGGKTESLGKLHDSGPEVERVRVMVDRLLPPYIPPDQVRVYTVDNAEWNAMAMGNFSIYVFTGILADLDDDELALVIGHEIVHASHEHSRKQQKRGILTTLAAISTVLVAQEVLEKDEATVAGILAGLGATAFANGYSRDQEDQADRVGMRYAFEAGYDVSKGPPLWRRFGQKYGEQPKTINILFGDHSRSSVRAAALEQEIALNYPTR